MLQLRVLRGPQPVLVDSGFGTDLKATLALLSDEPTLVFNTHWHSDHVGGNAGLASDVAWINPFRDGAEALETAIATLERIGLLDAHVAVAGHGGVIEDVADCIKGSLERLRLWRQEPRRMAYHGSRRIFGFALMIHGGFPRSQLMPYLQARRWVRDFAPLAGLPSQEFAERVVSVLLRSGAARWEEDRLISTVPHSRVTL